MNAGDIVKFYSEFSKLKKVLRTGWTRYLPDEKVESVADHSFGVTLLSLIISEKYFPNVNLSKIMKIGLIHDIAESLVGDITPFCKVSKEEKEKKEREAVSEIFSNFENKEEYILLWEEYNKGDLLEAKIVKEVDKLEMCLQANEYEKAENINLNEFFDSASKKITLEEIKEIFNSIRRKSQ